MSYNELIKNFSRIRAYMRSFYVYGFRMRGEYDEKSARGYDDEHRRIESWLGDYMAFRQDSSGRRFFLSVDSRAVSHNPLYRAFRTRSFTDRDIMLHFHLMDILEAGGPMTISGAMEALTDRLNAFDSAELPDESTVRRKLSECAALGLVAKEKRGRETVYRRVSEAVALETWRDALDFFSEAALLGVVGDFCRDKLADAPSPFRFKHHYILNALDSEILCDLAQAIGERREAVLTLGPRKITAVPLKIYISTQTGRQYALAWTPWNDHFGFFRLDAIDDVRAGRAAPSPADLEARLSAFMGRVWGVAAGRDRPLTRLEMTVWADDGESHIPLRLQREKRGGRVERLDEHRWRYTAEVYDAMEMLPWIRSFIGRIVALKCDDPRVTERFHSDMMALSQMYGGDGDALS